MFEDFDEWEIKYTVDFFEKDQHCILFRVAYVRIDPEAPKEKVKEKFKNEVGDFNIREIRYIGRNACVRKIDLGQ